MRKKDRVKICAGLMLTVTTLCTALLAACAGGNAAAVFAGRPAVKETAAPQPAGQGALSGLVIAVDAGHGGYEAVSLQASGIDRSPGSP